VLLRQLLLRQCLAFFVAEARVVLWHGLGEC